jgi:methyl halide transferase
MTVEDHFREAYREGSTPWDIGEADFNLVQAVTTLPISPCKALDIGCGTGDNAIWLCQQNFDLIGIDVSEIAIEKATEKAAEANVSCRFAVLNILKSHVDGAPSALPLTGGASIHWLLRVNGRHLPNRSAAIWKMAAYGSV